MFSKQLVLAGLSVLTVTLVGVWGWSVAPERSAHWAFLVLFLPAFWGLVEFLQGGQRKERIMNFHRSVVAGLGLMMALKAGLQLAIATDLLDASWGPIARRITGVVFGCFLAIWGNYLPKLLSPWSTQEEWFDWQRVHRFAGWTAALSGIALVLVWLAMPLQVARIATVGTTLAFVGLSVGRKFLSVAEYSGRRPPTTPIRATSDAAGSD